MRYFVIFFGAGQFNNDDGVVARQAFGKMPMSATIPRFPTIPIVSCLFLLLFPAAGCTMKMQKRIDNRNLPLGC
jgi:hypothetical protein